MAQIPMERLNKTCMGCNKPLSERHTNPYHKQCKTLAIHAIDGLLVRYWNGIDVELGVRSKYEVHAQNDAQNCPCCGQIIKRHAQN